MMIEDRTDIIPDIDWDTYEDFRMVVFLKGVKSRGVI